MVLSLQIAQLFILSIPIACIAWTVTHEEIFKEPREFCAKCSKNGKTILVRKFFYLFTCEYCFSHYVTAFMILLTGYKLLSDDWRGYFIAEFSLVWIANVYMSIFAFIRLGMKKEKYEIEEIAEKLENNI